MGWLELRQSNAHRQVNEEGQVSRGIRVVTTSCLATSWDHHSRARRRMSTRVGGAQTEPNPTERLLLYVRDKSETNKESHHLGSMYFHLITQFIQHEIV